MKMQMYTVTSAEIAEMQIISIDREKNTSKSREPDRQAPESLYTERETDHISISKF